MNINVLDEISYEELEELGLETISEEDAIAGDITPEELDEESESQGRK